MTPPAKIRIEGVTKRYETDMLALDRVDLELAENSFTCLLGPSGCGKSTLLNMIAGFVAPTTGRILVDDAAVGRAGADRGVVFQEYALFPWRTALDNVLFGPMIDRKPRPEQVAIGQRYLALVGLEAHAAQIPQRIVGWHEAARRDRPRAGEPAVGAPDGRAVRRARRPDP
ncbi:MAG: ATP-binding cassette domain-containing protein [Pseudomonadota bacterium]